MLLHVQANLIEGSIGVGLLSRAAKLSWRHVEPDRLPEPPTSLAAVRIRVSGATPRDGGTIVALDGVAAGWLGAVGTTSDGWSELIGIVDWRRYRGPQTRIDVYRVASTGYTRYRAAATP